MQPAASGESNNTDVGRSRKDGKIDVSSSPDVEAAQDDVAAVRSSDASKGHDSTCTPVPSETRAHGLLGGKLDGTSKPIFFKSFVSSYSGLIFFMSVYMLPKVFKSATGLVPVRCMETSCIK